MMNDWIDLLTACRRSPERGVEQLRFCGTKGCWDQANASGFFTRGDRQRGKDLLQSNPAT
jgi:hypothetical protein